MLSRMAQCGPDIRTLLFALPALNISQVSQIQRLTLRRLLQELRKEWSLSNGHPDLRRKRHNPYTYRGHAMTQPSNFKKGIHESKQYISPLPSVRGTGTRARDAGEHPERRGAVCALRSGAL